MRTQDPPGRAGLLLATALAGVITLLTILPTIAPAPVGAEPAERAAAMTTAPAPDESASQVSLDGKPLFVVPSSRGSQTREERARKGTEAIQAVAGNRSIGLEALQVREVPALEETEIVAGGKVIFTATEQDAQITGKSRPLIARQYLEAIKDGIATHRADYAPQRMLEGAAKSGAATLVLLGGLRLLTWLYRLLLRRSERFYGLRLPTLRLGRREVIHPDQIRSFSTRLLAVLRLFAVVALISIYLNFVLASFPQTRTLSVGILASVFSAVGQLLQGFFSYLPKLIFLVVLIWVAFYAFKLLRFVFREIEEGGIVIQGFEPEWVVPTSRIAYFFLLAFFGIIAFPYLPGSGSDAFQGISIFLGVLISFGSSSAITNMIAGILLTYTRAFRLGDRVTVGDVTGVVVEKGLMVTRLLSDENHYVSIPNGSVAASNVINYRSGSGKDARLHPPPILAIRVDFPFTVPWQKAREILLDAADQGDLILPDPPPVVLHQAFHPTHVTYELDVHHYGEADRIRSALLQAIHERCEREGISLVIPRVVSLPGGQGGDAPDRSRRADRLPVSLG